MSLDVVIDLLHCPHCRQPFEIGPPTLRCAEGHAFDVARGGYVNLLSTAQPGNADTASMISAREELQNAGVFDEVTATLVDAVPDTASVIIDAGAGPGHQLAAVIDAVSDRRGLAVDVSAAACRRAARAHARVGAVVADVWRAVPALDHCAEVALSVFAPRNPSEFARVLRPDGILITVTPRPEHLLELRESLQLLGVDGAKDERLARSLDDHFTPVADHDVISRHQWSDRWAALAVAMGPNAYHRSAAEINDRLAALTWPRAVTVACRVGVWRRR